MKKIKVYTSFCKKATTITAFLCVALCAKSVDKFFIPDFSIKAGETKQLAIQLETDKVTRSGQCPLDYVAFQFDIYLPEGLTVEMQNGKCNFAYSSERIADHIITSAVQKDGAIRLVGVSFKNENFKKGNGRFITFNVTASKDFNGISEMALKKVIFSTKTGVRSELPDVKVMINDSALTGIDNVDSTADSENSAIYNIQGSKVGSNGNTNSLPSGVYIINDKKVVVK